ncbi:MAG: serine/threonine-protein kinase [Myxococcota bacterium]
MNQYSATGEKFGPYMLLRVLGRGGMGVVHVARSQLSNHPVVALKQLRSDVSDIPAFRERFHHECELALRLKHPRIVQMLDAGKVGDTSYMASELILGKDIRAIAARLCHQKRTIPFPIAIRILIDLLAGLDYVHSAKELDGRPLQLLHRDITPANVIVGYDGISRLTDFGLAKSLLTEQLSLTSSGVLLGTPSFMAPEVVRGKSVASNKSDMYALGAVMYRLLVGSGPYEGDDVYQILDKLLLSAPTSLQEVSSEVPTWLAQHIQRLMAREPSERPDSARQAGLDLVEDALRHRAVRPREDVGRWLQSVFDDDFTRQTENFRRDCNIDPDISISEPTTLVGQIVDMKSAMTAYSHYSHYGRADRDATAGTLALPTAPLPSERRPLQAPLPSFKAPAQMAPSQTLRLASEPAASTLVHREPTSAGRTPVSGIRFRPRGRHWSSKSSFGWSVRIIVFSLLAIAMSYFVGFRLGHSHAKDLIIKTPQQHLKKQPLARPLRHPTVKAQRARVRLRSE